MSPIENTQPDIGTPERKKEFSKNVLLADDQEGIRDLLAAFLKKVGYSVEKVKSGEEFIARLATVKLNEFGIFMTDNEMTLGGKSGVDVINKIRENDKKTAIILVSGSITEQVKKATKDKGVIYLHKPFLPKDIEEATEKARERFISSS